MKNIIIFNIENKDRLALVADFLNKAGMNFLGVLSDRENFDYGNYKKITFEDLKTIDFDYVMTPNMYIGTLKNLFSLCNLPLNKTRILYYDFNNAQKLLPAQEIQQVFYDSYEIKNNKLVHTLKTKKTLGKWTESCSKISEPKRKEITDEVFESYKKQISDLKSVPEIYQIGENWGEYIRATRPDFFEASKNNDKEKIHELLTNSLRNCMTTGMFGGEPAHNGFVSQNDIYGVFFECLKTWFAKTGAKEFDIEELGLSPEAGAYGINIEGKILHDASFMFNARANLCKKLLDNKKSIVAEIGGGVGLLGYYLAKISNITYIDFDLPDNLITASYYLKATYPDKKILIYDKKMPLTREFLLEYDIVLMPNFMVPYLEDSSVDMFVNTISFGEMNYETICEYYAQIQRCGRKYFYQENLFAPQGDYISYPVAVYPELKGYKQLYSTPSTWTYVFDNVNKNHMYVEQLYEKMA